LRHTLAQYDERLAYEIAMIKKMGYPGYFMIVWDFHPLRAREGHSRRTGPRLGRRQPRGLGAANHRRRSAYYDLIFERFLNPGTRLAADIDVDFCERRAAR
jgi:DNA polymerase-3 subunit alpha